MVYWLELFWREVDIHLHGWVATVVDCVHVGVGATGAYVAGKKGALVQVGTLLDLFVS